MTDDEGAEPSFDEEFWKRLYRRADRIRNLTIGVLPSSRDLGDESGPCFEYDLFDRLRRRAARIRDLPLSALPDSRLVGDESEDAPVFDSDFLDHLYRRVDRIRDVSIMELPSSERLGDQEEMAPDPTGVIFRPAAPTPQPGGWKAGQTRNNRKRDQRVEPGVLVVPAADVTAEACALESPRVVRVRTGCSPTNDLTTYLLGADLCHSRSFIDIYAFLADSQRQFRESDAARFAVIGLVCHPACWLVGTPLSARGAPAWCSMPPVDHVLGRRAQALMRLDYSRDVLDRHGLDHRLRMTHEAFAQDLLTLERKTRPGGSYTADSLAALRLRKVRSYVGLEAPWAAWPFDIPQSLQAVVPSIVHLSGHGNKDCSLVFPANEPKRHVSTIAAFHVKAWRRGTLFSVAPSEPFYFKCNEEKDPAGALDVGQVVVDVGVAPVVPAEFVTFRMAPRHRGTSLVMSRGSLRHGQEISASLSIDVGGVTGPTADDVSASPFEIDVVERKEMNDKGPYPMHRVPGKYKGGNISVTDHFEQWLLDTWLGSPVGDSIGLTYKDSAGQTVRDVQFNFGMIKSVEISNLKAGDTNAVTERVTIKHTGLSLPGVDLIL